MKEPFVFPMIEVVFLPEAEVITASIILPFFPFADDYNLEDIME